MPTRTARCRCFAFAAAALCAGSAAADFVGFTVENTTPFPEIANTFRVAAVFDDPGDRLVSVEVVDFASTAELWQHPTFDGDTAPDEVFVTLFPELAIDTFVTVGVVVDDGSDTTVTAPDLNFGPRCLRGAWLNAEPENPNGQSLPDADGEVVVMQLSTPDIPAIAGRLRVTYVRGDTGETEIDEADFAILAIPVCPSDLDGDLVIDAADLAILLANWGGDGAADLDCDGVVDAGDLAALLAAWGPCIDGASG